MHINIAYLYPDNLNLYGDRGNVEILAYRSLARNITPNVVEVAVGNTIPTNTHIIIMGGGPDSQQKEMYEDFLHTKKHYMQDFIENDGFGLYICGSYQLLGKYYKSADGSVLEGLSLFDFYTEHFGKNKPRCIGNTTAKLSSHLLERPIFKQVNFVGDSIVGFENHGGRTYLNATSFKLATVIKGFGNNGEDKTEGFLYKNSFGTYFHGPLLSKNPHIADYLIAGSLKIPELSPIDKEFDNILIAAHKKMLNV